MNGILGIIVIVGVATALGVLFPKVERYYRNKMILDREPVSTEMVFEEYYKDSNFSKDNFVTTWVEIGKTLHVDPEKLRPTDKLSDLVGIANQISIFSDVEDLLASLVNNYKSTDTEYETLGDIVKVTLRKGVTH